MMDVVTYPCWNLKLNHVSKRGYRLTNMYGFHYAIYIIYFIMLQWALIPAHDDSPQILDILIKN